MLSNLTVLRLVLLSHRRRHSDRAKGRHAARAPVHVGDWRLDADSE
jgi:hypothetical protein